MAQVYSQNIVGYINISLAPGLNLITAQLKGTNNNITTVVGSTSPVMADNSSLYKWNPAGQTFASGQVYSGGVWYDPSSGNPSTTTVDPGQGFFIDNAGTATTLTIVGDVPLGTNNVAVNAATGFYGDPVPVAQDIATNGFPIIDNAALYTWNNTQRKYNPGLIGGAGTPGAWYDASTGNPVVVAPAVGQGFVVNSPATGTWKRVFTVQ